MSADLSEATRATDAKQSLLLINTNKVNHEDQHKNYIEMQKKLLGEHLIGEDVFSDNQMLEEQNPQEFVAQRANLSPRKSNDISEIPR